MAGSLVTAVVFAASIAVDSRLGEASEDPAQSISPSQSRTLADSPSLPAAYSNAAEKTAACLEERGLRDVSWSADAAGKVAFVWGGYAIREDAQASGEVYKSCYFEHLDDIDRLWQQDGAQAIAAAERGRQVIACIESGTGSDLTGDESGIAQQIYRLEREGNSVAANCLKAAGTSMLRFLPE